MAKIKPAGSKKKSANRGALPCLLLVVSGITLITLLFFAMMRSG
jgi:hypothetical protein